MRVGGSWAIYQHARRREKTEADPRTHLIGAQHRHEAFVQRGVIEARGQIEQQRQLVVERGVRLGGGERGHDVE